MILQLRSDRREKRNQRLLVWLTSDSSQKLSYPTKLQLGDTELEQLYEHFKKEVGLTMGLGERVRISRPSRGKEQRENHKATVVTLIPVAKHPLEYRVRFEKDGTEHVLPADSLEPLTYEEEVEDGPFGFCIVNELMYCRNHRLEVCGSCGVDHHVTNYQVEVKSTDDFDVISDLIDGMKRIGVPSRPAPSKRAKKQAMNKALFRPVMNSHLMTIPDRLDPSSCAPWPGGLPVEPFERQATVFGFTEPDVPEYAKLPVRRVRENIMIAGRRWDQFLSSMSGNEPMARLVLQDEAQTQVISMDLVLPQSEALLSTSSRCLSLWYVGLTHCQRISATPWQFLEQLSEIHACMKSR